jgi:nickel/cobalt transporter (NicO) family protein
MRRALLVTVLALAVLGLTSQGAMAHPLGNFSVNHLTNVKVSSDRVDVHYVLDQAEIPTFQERDEPRSALLASKQAEVRRGLTLRVNGTEVPLELASPGRLTMPRGQGGLLTTRLEVTLSAAVEDPRTVQLEDRTFPGRVGWKAIVAEPGEGTAVRADAPSGDPTRGLRRYPHDLLDSPLDRRTAVFEVEPGDGSLTAPRVEGERTVTTREASGEGFAAVFDDAATGKGVLLLLLLAAFGWGALHALSPGHGKAMVAAYLIGTRGTARHAVGLGVTVTITHTLGVFALGLVTLLLSQYILPEDLYPWLTLVSGLLVLTIGAGVLRARIRWARAGRGAASVGAAAPAGHGPSAEATLHGHGPGARGHHHHHGVLGRLLPHHHHDHSHSHSHSDGHHHSHEPDHTVTRPSLIAMGAAAGLIPCPSALVVLLGAIAQHEVALGLLLIVAFSIGLAGTLTGLGLLVVYARRVLPRLRADGRFATVLPAASALAILIVGCVLTAQAVPGVV